MYDQSQFYQTGFERDSDNVPITLFKILIHRLVQNEKFMKYFNINISKIFQKFQFYQTVFVRGRDCFPIALFKILIHRMFKTSDL